MWWGLLGIGVEIAGAGVTEGALPTFLSSLARFISFSISPFFRFTLLLLLYPSPTGLLDCVEYSSQFRQPVAVYRRNALHVLFRCKQELVVYDVIGGVTHPVKRTSRVEMTRHAISHIHVLSNSLNTSCLMEVSSADTLNIPVCVSAVEEAEMFFSVVSRELHSTQISQKGLLQILHNYYITIL